MITEPAKTGICPTCKKPIAIPGGCFLCNLARSSAIETWKSPRKKMGSR